MTAGSGSQRVRLLSLSGALLLSSVALIAWPSNLNNGYRLNTDSPIHGCPLFLRQESARPTRRKLQGSCVLTLGSQTQEFSTCTTIATDAPYSLEIHTTLIEGSQGSSFLRVGLLASLGGTEGWVGFGLPSRPGRMVGSKAAVASLYGSGSTSIAGYSLVSYSQSSINAAKGEVSLSDASVEAGTDGSITAVFTIPINGTVAELTSSPLDVVYAIGPVSSTGTIMDHSQDSYPYDGATIELATLSSVATSPSIAPSADATAPSRAPAEAPASSPSSPTTSAAPAPGPSASSSAASALAPSSAPVPAPDRAQGESVTAPTTGADAAPAPSPAGTGASACVLDLRSLGGNATSYSSCTVVGSAGTMLYWSPVDAATGGIQNGSSTIALALVGGATDGYISAGVASSPGEMVGTGAVVVTRCALCASGASAGIYALTAESADGVNEAPVAYLSEPAGYVLADGTLVGTWRIDGDTSAASPDSSGSSSVATANGSPLNAASLVFAWGGASSSGALRQHHTTAALSEMDLTAASVDVASDSVQQAVTASSGNPLSSPKVVAHAALSTVGWGILLPIGALVVRSRLRVPATGAAVGPTASDVSDGADLVDDKPAGRPTETTSSSSSSPPPPPSPPPRRLVRHHALWFWLHYGLQTVGAVVGIAGVAIGYTLKGDWTNGEYSSAHKGIGSVVLALVILQVLLGILRPQPGAGTWRTVWRLGHLWLGRACLALAIANIFIGFVRVGELGVWPYATYAAFLGVLAALGVLSEIDAARARARAAVIDARTATRTTDKAAMETGGPAAASGNGSVVAVSNDAFEHGEP